MIRIFTILTKDYKILYMIREGDKKAKRISADKWFSLYDKLDKDENIKILPPLTEVDE